jgi:hypothetical protein
VINDVICIAFGNEIKDEIFSHKKKQKTEKMKRKIEIKLSTDIAATAKIKCYFHIRMPQHYGD